MPLRLSLQQCRDVQQWLALVVLSLMQDKDKGKDSQQ